MREEGSIWDSVRGRRWKEEGGEENSEKWRRRGID